ncbi:riboflavin-specific deaminase [Psychromonas marina]|uniref:Riboflavin-specific deaminase n=1 Tax=Psychromonas marina TaxID=88364 RepID=A0ABQ6E418_9GAMM|nr:bifunctional diaminohydroxyphosphoribosylaminopyrimidine deaminase/5-amino-6-(5-phosphoribosylamino)uracil reductase RibD [Psychromonas marina]GLS92126.1 riboflavin-specific deaminase [Psychromonas marina]
MSDIKFMLQALEISKKALPKCIPNPPVGCVLVKDGRVISEGFTQSIGGNHAELEAIKNYSGLLDNVTAYVTLEPCSFEGRTPSCAKMIADTNINKVIVATLDPDRRNNGKGIEILRDNGLQVEVGIGAKEVNEFINLYLGHS